MELIETITFNTLEYYEEMGKSIYLTGDRLLNFLDRMGLGLNDYTVEYYLDDQERWHNKYYYKGEEVEKDFFGGILDRIKKKELDSEKLKEYQYCKPPTIWEEEMKWQTYINSL